MAFNFIRAAAAGAAIALCATGGAYAAVNLPALKIDKTQTTLSGLSAGGFMAVQLHVAYSATFAKGVGVVAGGPFYCAEGSVVNATGRCMANPTGIPTSTLVSTTNTWASQGLVDPVANLQNSKVYLFSGTLDSVVKTGVMDALRTYYNSFVPTANVVYKKDIAAEHAMVTDDYGSGCSTKGAPYISDCNFDLAGAMLQHLYGTLNARNNAALPTGNFIEFNQSEFITNHGMATTGWAYVPQACQAGGSATCKLHVVLHGCKQNISDVQQQYVRNTGYNRWADSNNIVMLYPQTSTAATNSCFDWWGYDNANYAKKSGPQMAAIKAMVDRVGSGGTTNPPVDLPAPTGVSTSGATASSMAIGWNAVSGAASYNVYRDGNKTNALPVTATSYSDTGLAASTTYSWTVRAADANGAEGAVSAAASGTTLAASGGGTGTCTTASNYAHTLAGRAYAYAGFAYALGSNQGMGWWNVFVTTTLKQTSPGYYVIGTC
ncbi:PHB depolymerase family esterase [Acidovorax facilis]|uniref:extracellular catalytic domain type 2 short-chain-length polyhydroxyalkanoate depolymerase n=1 Tax=Acidovorax facilis TaxID=12917 RepID=UPI003CEF3A5D